jgi:hypothetical protein
MNHAESRSHCEMPNLHRGRTRIWRFWNLLYAYICGHSSIKESIITLRSYLGCQIYKSIYELKNNQSIKLWCLTWSTGNVSIWNILAVVLCTKFIKWTHNGETISLCMLNLLKFAELGWGLVLGLCIKRRAKSWSITTNLHEDQIELSDFLRSGADILRIFYIRKCH